MITSLELSIPDEVAVEPIRSIEEANEIVVNNMLLAKKFVRKHLWTKIEPEELDSLAMVGLVKASRSWNKARGAFSTIAWSCMLNEVRRVRKDAMAQMRGAGKVAEQMPIGNDGRTLDVGDDSEDGIDEQLDSQKLVRRVFRKLPKRLRAVLKMRVIDGLTHDEIGKRLGFSRGRSQQLEAQAMALARDLTEKRYETKVLSPVQNEQFYVDRVKQEYFKGNTRRGRRCAHRDFMIYEDHRKGESPTKIARRLGMSQANVFAILSRIQGHFMRLSGDYGVV